jgi:hypothetical protein
MRRQADEEKDQDELDDALIHYSSGIVLAKLKAD